MAWREVGIHFYTASRVALIILLTGADPEHHFGLESLKFLEILYQFSSYMSKNLVKNSNFSFSFWKERFPFSLFWIRYKPPGLWNYTISSFSLHTSQIVFRSSQISDSNYAIPRENRYITVRNGPILLLLPSQLRVFNTHIHIITFE